AAAVCTLSLHDALPISGALLQGGEQQPGEQHGRRQVELEHGLHRGAVLFGKKVEVLGSGVVNNGVHTDPGAGLRQFLAATGGGEDRKSTRLNSSHVKIS